MTIPVQPIVCPYCGMNTQIVHKYETLTLVECVNPFCDRNQPYRGSEHDERH